MTNKELMMLLLQQPEDAEVVLELKEDWKVWSIRPDVTYISEVNQIRIEQHQVVKESE